MKSFAFGQYYPVSSPIHSLDPRIKIILVILYIVAAFVCSNVIGFGLLLASVFVIIALSRIKFSVLFKSVRPLLYVFIFSFVLNIFLTEGDTLLLDFRIIKIYLEGIINALLILVRIIVLIMGASIFMTYTTTPIALTDGIESLLSPLTKMGFEGVHTFSMMMSIALRFIPTLMDETSKIMAAQKSRGADFESGSLLKRAKALLPILIPLFVSAINRAKELANAMSCRCYHGGKGRTKFRVLKLRASDFTALGIMIIFLAVLIVLNITAPIYNF